MTCDNDHCDNEGTIEMGKGESGYICQDCYENEIDMAMDFERDLEGER